LAKNVLAHSIDGSERFDNQRNESVHGRELSTGISAPSAAAPATDDVAGRYDTVRVSVTVTSQVIQLPACHRICVDPSAWTLSVRPQETNRFLDYRYVGAAKRSPSHEIVEGVAAS